jgi:hypothetical protein
MAPYAAARHWHNARFHSRRARAGSGDLAGDLTGVVEEARESSLAASLEREVSHDHGRHAPERVRHGEDPVLAVHAVRGFIARRRRRPLSG